VGALATGLFATTAINEGGATAFFYGNPHQLVITAHSSLAVAAYSFIGSYILLKLISKVTDIRVSAQDKKKPDTASTAKKPTDDT